MRNVPATMDAAWISGDYITDERRPIARVTIQHLEMKLFDLDYNVYASLVFGDMSKLPRELPNVKSVTWQRSVDTDIATCTVQLYNTAPQPVGTVFHPHYGIDQPGYYTFARGKTSFSSRWGDQPNEWQDAIVADNVLRTYEGYGCDPSSAPENDPHLVQTGTWIIKDVEYTASGLITLSCEDLGGILRDQICFHPVIPANFYPLSFSAEPKTSGFADGQTFTKTVDSGGNFDPAHPPPGGWDGPTGAPPDVVVSQDATSVFVNWTEVAAPPTGFSVVGYQIVVDNVRLPTMLPAHVAGARTARVPNLLKGNVYNVQLVVVYKRAKDGHEQVSSQSGAVFVSWRDQDTTATVPVVGGIFINTGPPATSGPTQPEPGSVKWIYTGAASEFVVVAYKADGSRQTFNVPATSSPMYFQTGLGDLAVWDFVIYPKESNGHVGSGGFASVDGAYLSPPVGGAPPHEPNPAQPQPVVTVKGVTTPLKPTLVKSTFSATSNRYYTGNDPKYNLYGHSPEDFLDGKDSTYWLSIGNEDPGRGFAYEWVEVSVPNVELVQVKFTTKKANYGVYLSVYAKGTWVHSNPHDVIPYDAKDPESHNGANIPYVSQHSPGSSEGPHAITLKTPIPGATKVRLTFHNLQDFDLGANQYRAAVREMTCYGAGTTSTTTTKTPPPIPGPPQDDNSPSIASTYTVFVPAHVNPGAGEQPGFYEDYTDIIKLLCAWGGFFWPQGATTVDSTGAVTNYDFGQGPFGFPAIDPVLGDESGGRVWGDFQDTGVAGIAQLPIPQWDKKSLLEGISYVRDIIGFLFYIDEGGGVVWRMPNYFSIGNYVGNGAVGSAGSERVGQIVTIDETQTLIDLRAKLSSRNVRERYFIASVDGKTGALSKGYNPNPIGLRRVGGWTDQHFGSDAECQLMADMIAVRALLSYHQDSLQIPGYPRIQIDDQVRIFERVTGEGYLHYVRTISSNNDMESGVWTYDMETSWLGDNPDLTGAWAFDYKTLSEELQAYLQATQNAGGGPFAIPVGPPADVNPPGATSAPTPSPTATTTKDVPKVAKLVQVTGNPALYVTDGITRRWVQDQTDRKFLVDSGLVPTASATPITAADLHFLILVGPDAPGAP